MTLPDVCMRLHLGYRTVYEMALRGDFGPCVRRGPRLYVSAAEVERVAAQREEHRP